MFHAVMLGLLRFLGGGVCHQLPEHSLQVGGQALPLCARCTGTYLGALAGLVTIVLRRRGRAGALPGWPALATLGAFFAAWGIDGLNSYLTFFPGAPHLYEPGNTLRLLTGGLEGLALSLLLWPVASCTFWRKPHDEPVTSLQGLAAPVLGMVAVVFLLSTGPPGLLYAAGVLSIVGLVSLFALLNALVLAIAAHREGVFDSALQAWPLLAGAYLLGTAELVGLSLLRHWLLPF